MEFALVFPVFLVIVLGFLDLGLMLLRHRLLSDAAERVARVAAVHGSRSQPAAERWGPSPWSVSGDDPLVSSVIAPSMTTMTADEIAVDVEWTDGNNRPGSRVQVTLTYQHDAILPLVWGQDLLSLQAGSVARISH